MKRSQTLTWVSLLAATSMFAACGGEDEPSTQPSGSGTAEVTTEPTEPVTLTVYSGISAEGMAPIVEAFEANHENITLEVVSQTAGEIAATLELEAAAGAIRADVIIGNHTTAAEHQAKYDLFAEFHPEELDDPAVLEDVKDPTGGGYAIPAAVQAYLIQYNSDLVTGDDIPTSWEDLLDERWTNQLAIGDPTQSGGAHAPLWFLVEYMKNEVGAPYGWEYYEALAELSPLLVSSQGPINEMILSGERQIGIQAANLAFQATADGGPALPLIPEEGAPSFVTVVSVVEESPGRDAAEAFAAWTLTVEGQEAFVEGYGGMPIRNDVEPPYQLDPDAKLVPVDGAWVSENREANQTRFLEIMS